MTPRTLSSTSSSAPTCFDLADLQGDWLTIEGRRAGELYISGQTFTLRFLDRTFYKGTFELLTDQTPRAMIMHLEEGPPKHRGKSAWCLYALEVGMLRWCPMEPGSADRLSEFPDMEDQRYLYTVFRRDIVDPD